MRECGAGGYPESRLKGNVFAPCPMPGCPRKTESLPSKWEGRMTTPDGRALAWTGTLLKAWGAVRRRARWPRLLPGREEQEVRAYSLAPMVTHGLCTHGLCTQVQVAVQMVGHQLAIPTKCSDH